MKIAAGRNDFNELIARRLPKSLLRSVVEGDRVTSEKSSIKSGCSAEQIAHRVKPIPPQMPCAEVFRLLMADADIMHLPVLKDAKIVGIVNRQDFTLTYTVLYGKEIYGRQPISALMDAEPMIVAASLAAETLNKMLVSAGHGSMLKGFIVVKDKDYFGVGSVMDVLASVADIMSDRARELDIARERAEQASISKTNFLASMSHELRTPLNAIIGFADLVRKESFGALQPPRYREYIEDIYQSGDHLLGLINEILDMAKIEAGRFELNEDIFDPSMTASRVLRMLQPSGEEAGLTFAFELMVGAVPMICADERHLQQVLLNLISNAIKFTDPGGTITICSLLNEDGSLEIQIRDTGIGIPADQIENIFEPFEQVENSHTRTKSGTGLGLPLARAMVEAVGGTLSLTSCEGVGTCACASIPAERVIHEEPKAGDAADADGESAAA
ncbi:MAG: ATP-binding protein [Parvibaculaceae bacterium]